MMKKLSFHKDPTSACYRKTRKGDSGKEKKTTQEMKFTTVLLSPKNADLRVRRETVVCSPPS